MIEADPEAVVDVLEDVARVVDEALPEGAVGGVAGLELDQLGARLLEDGGDRLVVAGGGLLCFVGDGGGRRSCSHLVELALLLDAELLVDALQLGDRVTAVGLLVDPAAPGDDQLAELRAPVAEVVVGDHLPAERAQGAVERRADDGRADVADVHRLGDVGGGVVDHHLAPAPDGAEAEPRVVEERLGALGEEAVGEVEVDEAGPGDLDLREVGVAGERVGDQLGEVARRAGERLAELEAGGDLEVAELRLAGAHDGEFGGDLLRRAGARGEGGGGAAAEVLEEFGQGRRRVRHGAIEPTRSDVGCQTAAAW